MCKAERSCSTLLPEDPANFQVVADDFARKELLPFAARWDAEKHFPVDKLRAAAQLGFGGILVNDDVGEMQRRLCWQSHAVWPLHTCLSFSVIPKVAGL